MIRYVIFVLFSIPCWGQSADRNIPSDSLKREFRFQKFSRQIRVNQQLRHHVLSEESQPDIFFNNDSLDRVNRREITTSSGVEEKRVPLYSLYGVTSGMWYPTGHDRVLGPHPSMGIVCGAWAGRWMVDCFLDFRFLCAANPYQVQYNGVLTTTHHYFDAYFGVHLGYGIANFKNSSIYLLIGLGQDGFDAIDNSNPDDKGVTINSFNLSGGIGYQYFAKKGPYWGIEMMYNDIHYRNPGGTPLNGNALTFKFTFGIVTGPKY